MFLEARCDATAVFDPVEEAFDAIALPVERLGEAMSLGSIGLVGDVGGRTLGLDTVAYPIGVMGFVGQQDIAVSETIEKQGGAERVVGLARSVSSSLMGRPRTSVSAWILVVSPPRERPIQ